MRTIYAMGKKEMLRKNLITRRVSVKVEYTAEPGPEAVRKKAMACAILKREGIEKSSDVAVALISGIRRAIVQHRRDKDRENPVNRTWKEKQR